MEELSSTNVHMWACTDVTQHKVFLGLGIFHRLFSKTVNDTKKSQISNPPHILLRRINCKS